MGVDPPFLYDHPSRTSFTGSTEKHFNPKAVSQASWTPQPERPKQVGPLVKLNDPNRHPDSYLPVPYGNLNWQPMSPQTRIHVKLARGTQLLARACSLVGAIGLLICVICIRGTDNTLGWIIRVAPGIAILHTVYATYHLLRSKNRTPSSSASYHLFAAVVDATLVPFYVFASLISRSQYTTTMDQADHWTTLFSDEITSYKVFQSTLLLSITCGGLHLFSLLLSVYLAVKFRAIAKLPPDMNPLEPNLTSRHKRNKSSLSVADSLAGSGREAHLAAPLINPPRTIPFMHTRNDSSNSISSFGGSPERRGKSPERQHPGPDNRASYTSLPSQIYSQPAAQRSSQVDLNRRSHNSPPKHSSMYVESRPLSDHSHSKRPISMQSSTPSDSNWVSYPSPTSSPPLRTHFDGVQPSRAQAARSSPSPTRSMGRDLMDRSPRPLEMNPPTLPPFLSQYPRQPPSSDRRSVATQRGGYTLHQSSSPQIDPHKSPRRHPQSRALLPTEANANSSPATPDELEFQRSRGMLRNSELAWPNEGRREKENAGDGVLGGKSRFYGNMQGIGKKGFGQRVVSTGTAARRGLLEMGMGLRAREVSGKVVEEGRAR